MDRIVLTPEQQAIVDAKRIELNVQPGDPIQEGTNLVQGDSIRVNDSWDVFVVCGESGVVGSFVPAWDNFYCAIDLVESVTDRAGPNGETMPIFDEVQLQAMAARAGAPANPKRAAKQAERDHKKANRELVAAQPNHHTQKLLREALKAHGLLGKDD